MPIQIMKRYTRLYIKQNPQKSFIFGDNLIRDGLGGQAREARGEFNSIGIATKKAPTYNEEDFLTDKEYAENIWTICDDFHPAFNKLIMGKTVVWPEDGIGTGIAQLSTRAPLTLQFINTIIDHLKKVYGTTEV